MNIEEYKNKNRFTVPQGYFDNLHERIMTTIPRDKKQPSKRKKSVMLGRISGWSYAAAITLIFFIGGAIFQANNNTQQATANNEYDNELIEEVLTNYPIDDYTFYCYLTNNDTEY